MQLRRSISSFALEQVIDSEPLIVTPDRSVLEAINQMSQVYGSGCQLPNPSSTDQDSLTATIVQTRSSCALVMEQERLVGLFTERDLVRLAASASNLDTAKIGEVMTRSVVSLSSSDAQNIFLVLATFRQHRIRHLPILDSEGQVVGVVTPQSIRRALQPLNFLKLKPVADVMTTDVVRTSMSASVLQIAQLMSERCVSCVVIMGEGRKEEGSGTEQYLVPVGIITERDIVQFQTLGLNLARTQAQAVMSAPLFPVQPQDSLWSAHQQMLFHRVRRLVVTGEKGELIGIITQSSVLQVLDPVELMGDLEQLQQVLDSQSLELQQTNQHLRDEVAQRERLEATLRETNAALEQQVGLTQAQLVRANASLRDSEARYRQLFENNPHPMWVYDLETLAFLAVNDVVLANDVTEQIQAEAALRQKTQTLERYSSSLEKLHHISTTNYQDFDALFADYLGAGCEILGLTTGIVSSIDRQTYTICAVRSNVDFLVSGLEFALGDTYCAAVVAENKTITYTHVGKMPAMQSHPVYQNLRLESYIGTPIYVEEEIYGTLNFSSTEVRTDFEPYEREIVELMAQSLGSFIAAARLDKKRQQAEQATQEALKVARNSENRLQTIIDSEPECVKLVDSDGQVLDMNPTGLSILEADSLEQVKGQSVYDLIATEYRQAFQELNHRVCQGDKGILEFEIISSLGNRRWMETHAAPLWDEDRGEFIQLAITRDITDRKRSEVALRDSEERYRTLSEKLHSITANAPVYIYELDRHGRILFANRTYEGVTQAQVIGALLTDWFPEEQRPTITSVVEQAYSSKEVQEVEYAIPNPQGETRFYTTQIAPNLINGIATSAVLIATDTTDRKRAEQELERFFSLSLDLLCIADFDGYFKRLNPAFEQTLGWSDQELRSQPFLQFAHPDDRDATSAAVQQLASGAQVISFENRDRTANGE